MNNLVAVTMVFLLLSLFWEFKIQIKAATIKKLEQLCSTNGGTEVYVFTESTRQAICFNGTVVSVDIVQKN